MIFKEDLRPFWKSLLEALILGAIGGVIIAIVGQLFGKPLGPQPPKALEYIALFNVVA